jgi:hypothetical protein
VRRPHAGFIVPNGCSTVSRRYRMAWGLLSRRLCTSSRTGSLPARDPWLLASRTAKMHSRGTRGPIAPELPPSLFVSVAVGQLFASRTTIRILVAEIDKVLFANSDSVPQDLMHRLRKRHRNYGNSVVCW